MDKANLLPGEKVDIIDLNNGSRLSTYAIEGAADTGVVRWS
jgi:aspartate 1-decarboxylase